MISRGQLTRLHEVSDGGHSWKPATEDKALPFSNMHAKMNFRNDSSDARVKSIENSIGVQADDNESDRIKASLPEASIPLADLSSVQSVTPLAIKISSGDDAEQLAELWNAPTSLRNTNAPPPLPTPLQRSINTASHFSAQRIVLAIAAAVGMLATFLPWVKAPIIGSIDGTAGDGWITLGLFACSFALCFSGDRSRSISGTNYAAIVIPSLLAGLIGVWKVFSFRDKMAELRSDHNTFTAAMSSTVQIGIGIYLLIIAAAAMIILPLLLREQKLS